MKAYDVVVIGSGSGTYIAARALYEGLSVALIDHGPLGGTCPNTGCIPSKMLISAADRIMEIRESKTFGISAKIENIDIPAIFERMRAERLRRGAITRTWMEENQENLDFYSATGHFIDDYTLVAGRQTLRGEKIFIASGSRPAIPPVSGLSDLPYLTNETVLDLAELPESLIIVGGGSIAAEYGHFFSAMGTEVTILGRNAVFLPREEPEYALLLRSLLEKRVAIITGIEVKNARRTPRGCLLTGIDPASGAVREFAAEAVLIATGRVSNADLLHVGKTGVALDSRGFIAVNEFLETSKEKIWSIGDANGRYMFRPVANQEARIAWHNATHTHKVPMDYRVVPHAVFAYPPLASVGLNEDAARSSHDVVVGRAAYRDVARGVAIGDGDGRAKIIVERNSGTIRGFHIIGPSSFEIIQEVVQVMVKGGTFHDLENLHIHPTLSELLPATIDEIKHSIR
jgi:mycothione reductase